MARVLTYGALVASALVLQLTVVDLLPLPGGTAPDLVLLVVVALALSSGPLPGLVTGFAAGLALDLAPPASHAIGAYALVFCLVGYVCGRAAGEVDKSAILPLVAMALGALAGSILYTVVGVIFGEPGVTWAAARNVLPLSVAYDVLLSPFVLYLVLRLTWRAWQKADDPAAALARAGSPGTFNAGRPAGAQKQPRLRPGAGRPAARIGVGARGGVLAASGRSSGGWGGGTGAATASGRQAPLPRLRFGGSGPRGAGAGVGVSRTPRLRFGGSGPRGAGAGVGVSRTPRLRFGGSGPRGAGAGVGVSRTPRLRFGGSGPRGAGAGVGVSRTPRLRFGGSGPRGAGAGVGVSRTPRLRFGGSGPRGAGAGVRRSRTPRTRLRFGASVLPGKMARGKPGVFSGGSLVGGSSARLRLGTGRSASRLLSRTGRTFRMPSRGHEPARPRFTAARSGGGRIGTGNFRAGRFGAGRSGVTRSGRGGRSGKPRFGRSRFGRSRFSRPRSSGPRSGWMRSNGAAFRGGSALRGGSAFHGGTGIQLRRGGWLTGVAPRGGWSAIWRISSKRTGGFR